MEKFGEKLRILRKRRRLTTRALGDLLSVSHAYISQMERGKDIPNIAMAIKIADIFGVTVDMLVRDEIALE